MSSILPTFPSDAPREGGLLDRLAFRSQTSASSLPRRLSDPSASTGASSSTSQPSAVRSRDGSRWLPTPDEQSHRVGFGERQQTGPTPKAAPELSRHSCDAAICSVAKVFETTELLESILCLLDTSDVLSLRRTNKHWNSAIQSSPHLRLHFFTYPQWERPPSEYQLLPLSVPGVTIEKDEPIHLGQWMKVTLTPEAAKRICPEPEQRVRSRSIFEGLRGGLGRSSNDIWPNSPAKSVPGGRVKYADLHISQPPLLGMQAYLIHQTSTTTTTSGPRTASLAAAASTSQREPQAIAKVSCDSGITLGFLAETAQDLLTSQTSGPSNAGEVKVVFKAIISFCESDSTPRRSTRRNQRTVTRLG